MFLVDVATDGGGCGCQSIVCLHAFEEDTTRLVTWIAEFVDGWMNE